MFIKLIKSKDILNANSGDTLSKIKNNEIKSQSFSEGKRITSEKERVLLVEDVFFFIEDSRFACVIGERSDSDLYS